MIYFDNAATSFIKPRMVKNATIEAMERYTANPGRSGHYLSLLTAQKVYETRENIKNFFNAENYDVIFTKNCTEALNLAIFGTLKAGDHIITTCYEHNSVLRPLEKLKEKGVEVSIVFCEMKDLLENIKAEKKQNTKMIITTLASNVTGESPDYMSIAKYAQANNILCLFDGAQACGHIKLDLHELGCDMLAFAGHKGMLSISGVGGLIVKRGVRLNPILYGGTGTNSESLIQPSDSVEGFEAGTIPVIPILSLNAGVEFLTENFEKIIKKEEKLSKYMHFQLKKLTFLKIFSKNNSKNVFSFNVEGVDSMIVANILNEDFGICVRSGLHCAPLVHKYLGTLETGAVRVSLDFNNTEEEIDKLIFALCQIHERLQPI